MTDRQKSEFVIPREVSIAEAVTSRLQQWRDYYENKSTNSPPKAYSIVDKVADAIFISRKPILSNITPDPVIDLRVSPEAIMESYQRAEKGDKYIF